MKLIASDIRAFGVIETYYRYGPKLRAENEEIADLLIGLTLRNPQSSATAPVAQPAQRGKTQTRSLAHAG